MDEFIRTVRNSEIPLHALDTQAAFLNIPYQFFYGNPENQVDFMPSAVLRRGFYRALQRFPILAGYLKTTGPGQTSIVVDQKDLNMPTYVETLSKAEFSAMEAANFHHSSWPPGLYTVGAITKADAGSGRIKMLNVHVVRMAGGVVVFVNIPHYAVDGTGFFSFVELWGMRCRQEQGQFAPGEMNYCFDRALVTRSMPEGRSPLNQKTLDVYRQFDPLADWVAWLSPNTRGRLLDMAKFSSGIESHTFCVSKQALDGLCAEVGEFTGSAVNGTHVLAALMSMTVAQAHKACREEAGQPGIWSSLVSRLYSLVYPPKQTQFLSLMSDVRHALGISDQNYMGNGLLPHNTECPLALLEVPTGVESLARTAEITAGVYRGADGPRVASFIDLISVHPYCFTRPMFQVTRDPTLLAITNETEFKLYMGDFGHGPPKWVCTIPSFVANFVGFLPSPPPSTDIIVNMTLKANVMGHVLKNEFWRNLSSIVY
ncbi:hypothetical protein GGF46_003598 [Coemansia sp. RSA 552]|nr:hypothetical protein GGF46_003598 [Coemansia sp. RSA 552]